MPNDLSIKDTPDELVSRLRERAARNHRSLESEILAILAAALGRKRKKTPAEILAEVQRLGLSTPGESAILIRESRDGRNGGQSIGGRPGPAFPRQ